MRKDTKSSLDLVFHHLSKHSYFMTGLACALLIPFGFTESSNLTTGSLYYAAVVCASVIALFVFGGQVGKDDKTRVILWASGTLFCGVSLFMLKQTNYAPVVMLFMPLILIAAMAAMMKWSGALTTRNLIVLMVAAGIILRFVYIMYTDSGERQHDVGYFNWTWGHANYIEYWYNNGLRLPDFDVRTIWQYYHPPLHHWLMAVLLWIYTQLGVDYDTACQGLQILPMLYSSLIMVVCYRIFRWVKLNGTPLVIAMMLICFHPTFVLMGGFFNNDILCVLLMMLSTMFALRWYRQPTLLNILPIALSVGLGMMAKLNAWMVAPAIAIVFLYVFIKNIKSWLNFIGQFAVFGVICVPLGLWWQVRNLIAFGVPLTYVPYLGDSNNQYLGNMTVTKRLFDFGGEQLRFVFDAFTDYGAPYNEFNPTLGLIKTSLFSEGHHGITTVEFPQLSFIGPALFWVGVILALLCFFAFIVMMLSKTSGLDGVIRVFFAVLAATMLSCYYLYEFAFPFTCSLNIRFCVPLIPLFTMGLGLLLQTHKTNKVLRYVTYSLTGVFTLLTMMMFCMID